MNGEPLVSDSFETGGSVGSEDKLGVRGFMSTWGRKGRAGSAPPSQASRYPALLSLSWPLLQHEPQRELPGVSQVGASLCFCAR